MPHCICIFAHFHMTCIMKLTTRGHCTQNFTTEPAQKYMFTIK